MKKEIKIGSKIISDDSPCFVIVEIGHNHQGNIETTKKMIDEAAFCGAQAVKLQKRANRSLYTTAMFNKPYENENSFGLTYGAHREALEFGKAEYLELKKYAEDKGLIFFATAFDFESVDFLEEIGVPAYKIASGDITNHPLLDYVGSKKKPVIISSGACDLEEVKAAYVILRKHTDQICIMQCTASYPAKPEDIHLNVIKTLKEEFPEAIIGYSGHDNGIVIPVVAYVLGARMVEKHFTLNRTMKGTDHKFSLEPQGLRKMVRDLNRIREAFGSYEKKCHDFERSAKEKMGKSIMLKNDLKKGTVISEELIVYKSPGSGIPPSRIHDVIGKKIKQDLEEEALLSFEYLEQ
ncbi:MAG: N-acetylneuraminate synthase family protein [Candidatus Margulisiibacteriota bacterium]|nr:N-acetylneuraminate synthase family protein [Candidatus Margulisiibacteriota bacterium]